MQLQNDKTASLIGFAIKSGNIIFGADNIVLRGKRKHLIVLCNSLSERTARKIIENTIGVSVLICKSEKLEDIVHRPNCKAIALTDRQMSNAILNNFDRSKYDLVSEDK